MNIVIQCAGSKKESVGMMKRSDGHPVMFVADPKAMQPSGYYMYAHPDNLADGGKTWREVVEEYNKNPGTNCLDLLRAWDLYKNPVYSRLVEKFGCSQVFILSAGWGLVRADFLLPNYNITFSSPNSKLSASYKKGIRRNKTVHFNDFCCIPKDSSEPILFFGGVKYLPLFYELTRDIDCHKTVFYKSENSSLAPDNSFNMIKYDTPRKTNWHYDCANALIDGKIRGLYTCVPRAIDRLVDW